MTNELDFSRRKFFALLTGAAAPCCWALRRPKPAAASAAATSPTRMPIMATLITRQRMRNRTRLRPVPLGLQATEPAPLAIETWQRRV